jgi:hypothetical protein
MKLLLLTVTTPLRLKMYVCPAGGSVLLEPGEFVAAVRDAPFCVQEAAG